jgi:hypothetical protein
MKLVAGLARNGYGSSLAWVLKLPMTFLLPDY